MINFGKTDKLTDVTVSLIKSLTYSKYRCLEFTIHCVDFDVSLYQYLGQFLRIISCLIKKCRSIFCLVVQYLCHVEVVLIGQLNQVLDRRLDFTKQTSWSVGAVVIVMVFVIAHQIKRGDQTVVSISILVLKNRRLL